MYNKWVKICWNKKSILHTVICISVLYEFCIKMLYIMFMMHAFCRSELMYTKCIQNVCIQNVSHISTKFCMQNVYYKMCVYKMYTTFWQTFAYILYTKLSWHSSFDFVYKMYSYKSLSKCGIHFIYIFCTSVVYILYNFCIQNVYTGSVWEVRCLLILDLKPFWS